MVVRLSGTQPQGPKHLETLENKTVDGTQNTVRVNRGVTANRPAFPVVGEFYYNTDKQAFEQYTSAGWFNIAQAPSAPTSVVATDQGSGRSYNDGQASVAFTPNSSGGAPSSFIVTPSPATSPATFTTTSSPVTITGLSSSTQYTYTVSATGTYGTSAASAASAGVTATTVPQPPTLVASPNTDTTASIAITAGQTGGSAITEYQIISNPNTTIQTTSSSPYIFTGLTTGTAYTFTATAINLNGSSSTSSASNSITPLVPGSFESIASYFLSSNGTVTFSSIPQDYKILQVRFHGAAQDHYIHMKTNLGNGTWSMGPRNLTSSLGINISAGYSDGGFYLNNGGVSVTYRGSMITEFIDYANPSKAKTAVNWYGSQAGSSNQNNMLAMLWDSTAAINSITISSDSGYVLNGGTVVGLYGIRG
jgi:hypothetical protein